MLIENISIMKAVDELWIIQRRKNDHQPKIRLVERLQGRKKSTHTNIQK